MRWLITFDYRLMETHAKTSIVLGAFSITFAGWWAWNAFLSGAYSDNISPYDVKGGFLKTFGNDWRWWLVLIVTVMILVVTELILKAAKKALVRFELWPLWERRGGARMWERELEVWQEVEKDPGFMMRLIGEDGGELDNGAAQEVHGAIELRDVPATASSSGRRPVYERRETDTHGKVDVRVSSTEVRR